MRPNAAFYFAPDNYQIAGEGIVGRQSATGGFLRGFIQHGGVETHYIYADQAQVFPDFQEFVTEAGGGAETVAAFLPVTTEKLGQVGTVFRPGPDLGALAWRRRHFDQRGFSIAGITHTVCETMAMQVIGNILVAPVQPWDALVCTSNCVKGVVERILEGWAEYLGRRFGTEVAVPCRLPVIPLRVDSEALAARGGDSDARADLRSRMGIEDGDIALIYAGRLNHVEKANPVPMYLAAEAAAKETGARLHLIQAGQATNDDVLNAFKAAATAIAPSVSHHFVDGAMTELFDKVWAAADLFISLSDNIQESFGLTPIEAMASGLPCLVSDYDGYRESVRDGVDGLTVPTSQPPPGAGAEMGFLYDTGFVPYPVFTAATSQSTAVDIEACARALVRLIGDAGLRAEMGAAGQARAAEVYDWKHVVAAHQDLWAELAEVRVSAAEVMPPEAGETPYPLAADPFHLFQAHPTGLIAGDAEIAVPGPVDRGSLKALITSDVAAPLAAVLLDEMVITALLEKLADEGPATAATLTQHLPPEQTTPLYLTLGWLAKVGLVTVTPVAAADAPAAGGPFGKSETWGKLGGG